MSSSPDGDATKLRADALGWVGSDRYSTELEALREYLRKNTGMKNLQTFMPEQVQAATAAFRRDGFVVVRNALNAEQLQALRAGCDREMCAIVERDPNRRGNRGFHRYSFGGASLTGHLMHCPEWAMLLDLPTVTPILCEIFGTDTYHARGGGGDFCLPGAVRYQRLHSDMSDRQQLELNGEPQVFGSFHDERGTLTYRDLPCPYVCCNFLTVDFTPENGPIRQIPGTQYSKAPIPPVRHEPEWMKLSTLCPAPAGSVVIRDVRAWHGGTPNLSEQARAIPNVEFFAPWYREPVTRSLPLDLYQTLSPHARQLAAGIVMLPGDRQQIGYRDDIGYLGF